MGNLLKMYCALGIRAFYESEIDYLSMLLDYRQIIWHADLGKNGTRIFDFLIRKIPQIRVHEINIAIWEQL
jgi:hypothetical protein